MERVADNVRVSKNNMFNPCVDNSASIFLLTRALCWLIPPALAEEPMQVKYLGNNVDLVSEDYYLALTTAALKVTEPSHGAYQLVFT